MTRPMTFESNRNGRFELNLEAWQVPKKNVLRWRQKQHMEGELQISKGRVLHGIAIDRTRESECLKLPGETTFTKDSTNSFGLP